MSRWGLDWWPEATQKAKKSSNTKPSKMHGESFKNLWRTWQFQSSSLELLRKKASRDSSSGIFWETTSVSKPYKKPSKRDKTWINRERSDGKMPESCPMTPTKSSSKKRLRKKRLKDGDCPSMTSINSWKKQKLKTPSKRLKSIKLMPKLSGNLLKMSSKTS